jgi:hypothetical protein
MSIHYFVCDKCNHIDSRYLAYPERDLTEGPPMPWLCLMCQSKPWHNHFPRRVYVEGEAVINRVNPGLTISMG